MASGSHVEVVMMPGSGPIETVSLNKVTHVRMSPKRKKKPLHIMTISLLGLKTLNKVTHVGPR